MKSSETAIMLVMFLGPLVLLLGVLWYRYNAQKRRGRLSVPENVWKDSSKVKLSAGDVTAPRRIIGDLEVVIRAFALSDSSAVPPLTEISDMLMIKASHMGANVVTGVRYYRQLVGLLGLRAQYVLRARGTAVLLDKDAFEGVTSDAETVAREEEAAAKARAEDPEVILARFCRREGISNIVFAVVNAGMVYVQQISLMPNQELRIPPLVIYALSAWLLCQGILMLSIKRPIMLILDGLLLLAIGCINLAGGLLVIVGIAQIIWGIQTIAAYRRTLVTTQERG